MINEEKLESTKRHYPFEKWKGYSLAMEQYTEENCDAAKTIFDNLIIGLKHIGENGQPRAKEELFKIAIEQLNDLNNEVEDGPLIETGEREDLCELIDRITIASGLNPKDYSDGKGIADEWREW